MAVGRLKIALTTLRQFFVTCVVVGLFFCCRFYKVYSGNSVSMVVFANLVLTFLIIVGLSYTFVVCSWISL